ncbi:LOW QUALITY PROTEIN: alkylglycerol monooxygenase [Salvelinus alpinus]
MAQFMDVVSLTKGIRLMFYIVTPNKSSFENVEDVPPYFQQATTFFMGLMVVELVVSLLKDGAQLAFSDVVTSVSAGIISRMPTLFASGFEITTYIYMWNNFCLLELPWDSAAWWLAFLAVDFAYYWVHRFAHELNLLWATHQVHHSSEYYNLSTALRQSLTQQFSSWVFYLPMALAVPPSVFAVHIQFNLVYQFWIHTEVIRDMGPLEWVLNTPSHHRVHHGRNYYCIDKNDRGTLIIWNRLFGTFAPDGDKVVYGLVHKTNTLEILHIQFNYYKYLWRRYNRYKKIFNKLGVLWKGPSWKPGKAKLGDHAEVPEVTGEELPYNPSWPLALQVYVCIHGLMLLCVYQDLFESRLMLSQLTVLMTGYIHRSLTSIGFIINQRSTASMLELLRCVLMVMPLRYGYMTAPAPLAVPIEAFVSISLLYWGMQTFSQLIAVKKKTT